MDLDAFLMGVLQNNYMLLSAGCFHAISTASTLLHYTEIACSSPCVNNWIRLLVHAGTKCLCLFNTVAQNR